MLTPSNEPKLVNALLRDLTPIHASIRQTCECLGIDVTAADRALARHEGRDQSTLPWGTSPQEFAKNTKDVLKNDIPPNADISECLRVFTEEVMISAWPQWGYLQAVLTVDYSKWSTASRNAAISLCCDDPMEDFELGLYITSTDEERRDECEAIKAWLVYNILAVDAIQKHPFSENCKEIVDQLVIHEVSRLASLYTQHLQTGELADFHPFRAVDDLLLRLGALHPELGGLVKDLLGAWEHGLQDSAGASRMRFDNVLGELLPDSTDVPSLDGEVIGRSARDSLSDFMDNIGFANSFKGLVDQPEWSNPLESVRELVSEELHKVNIYSRDSLFSQQSVALIHRILDGMSEKPNLIFPSSALELASADSASINNILDGLRGFIATGRKSFADFAGVSSINHRQLQDVIEGLDLMRGLVGEKKIHLVTNSEMEEFVDSGKVQSGILFGVGVDIDRLPTIAINLIVKDGPNERIAKQTREILASGGTTWPRFLAGAIRRGVSNYVVPTLAATEGGADHEGLVGFKPLTAVAIAEQKRLVKPLDRDSIELGYVLQVHKVSDFDEEDALDPVDVEDSSLTPAR